MGGLHITGEGIIDRLHRKFGWSWSTQCLRVTCLHGAPVDMFMDFKLKNKNAMWIWLSLEHYMDVKCSELLDKVLGTFTDLLCCKQSPR